MSNSVSPVEVEDVLSSIRRLVSDDTRTPDSAAGHTTPNGTAEEPAEEEAGKLLLTDALRVPGAEDDPGGAEDAAEAGTEDAAPETAEAAPDDQFDDAEAAAAADGVWADEAPVAYDRPHLDDLDGADEPEIDVEAEVEDVEPDAPEVSVEDDDTDPGSEMVDFGSAGEDSWMAAEEAEGTFPANVAGSAGMTAETGRRLHLTASMADLAAEQDSLAAAGVVPGDAAQDETWGDEPEEDWPAAEAADETAEDDQATGDDPGDQEEGAMETPHDGGMAVTADLAERAREDAVHVLENAVGEALWDLPAEGILDEEALREMIAQTVREELMGELGERITRNVKKLVRREIHRALTSREFD